MRNERILLVVAASRGSIDQVERTSCRILVVVALGPRRMSRALEMTGKAVRKTRVDQRIARTCWWPINTLAFPCRNGCHVKKMPSVLTLKQPVDRSPSSGSGIVTFILCCCFWRWRRDLGTKYMQLEKRRFDWRTIDTQSIIFLYLKINGHERNCRSVVDTRPDRTENRTQAEYYF